ncbi:MAG: response regulator [Geobacteraceae bacterium]|nr:response regulator [Geobacteraceae bacterium]
MSSCILLVDDEQNVLSALMRELADEPYGIVTALSGEEALGLISAKKFKVIISDERMPGMDGASFLSAAKEISPSSIRMMLTGHASIEATMRAVNSGEIFKFFTKPWNSHELKQSIKVAIERYDLEDENQKLLKVVKRQSQELKALETHHPGITRLTRDREGAVILPEISDDEIRQLLDEFGHN